MKPDVTSLDLTEGFRPALLAGVHQRMKAVAGVARLPLRSGLWSGVAGSVLGQGTGSSIDFQDQRPYLPGDDPRHINWQAYARTGNYTMKLYRQEVTPRVDLLLDLSASMFLTEAKAQRTWELVYFCLESALRLGAAVRVQALGQDVTEVPLEQALAHDWPRPSGPVRAGATSNPVKVDVAAMLERCPLRAGSLRVLVSDLLSETPPERIMNALLHGKGRAIVFAPFCIEEAHPSWEGNIEFEECESVLRDKRRVDKDILVRYLKAYQMHFSLWREQAVRRGAGLARVAAEPPFLVSLRAEALGAGVVEMG